MKTSVFTIVMLMLSVITISYAGVVVDKQGIEINKDDVDLLLKVAPEKAQLNLLNNKEQFQVKLVQLYLTKAIAVQGKRESLTVEQQVELNKMIDLFYFRLIINQLTKQNLPKFEPLAKLEYQSAKEKYLSKEKIAVEHILINTKKRNEADALKLVQEIRGRIINGDDFNQLAKQYSDDPTVKKNQGKLGLFEKGKMVKPFEEAAYSLKMGELSVPIKTKFGYHLLKKYKHIKAGIQPYTEVKDQIVEKLKKEFIQTRLDDYYDEIKKNNKMQINEKELDALIKDKKLELEKI